ncbi:PREDICTED: protein-cysteine N-palmitoyltransferase porcupine [Ceratosolen solmsi marchali]|uniref:Protein-serine O-palmitoleoyltransferase porcupine n=1 Tax=Ceratosolen solmsi marchali TaxID=326594 RepID=A0AAJ7DVA9_9HYME|nr:PREDICTED: protein-cysteine N-palmitoyltransferase porcupine [Ceratosolen solmsi marchali]
MDSVSMYDDNECGDQCFTENTEDLDYDFVYDQETPLELYHYCIFPTVKDTIWYLVPLIVASLICNVAARISQLPHNVFHCVMAFTGIFTIWNYAYECFYLLLLFILFSYIFLYLPMKFRRGTKVFIPSLLFILYCEFFMNPKEWHKIRGVVMIATMKASSVAVDKAELSSHINFYEYVGYMLCSVTALFGPWTSFENYRNLYKKTTWKFWWIFIVIGYMAIAFFCLCISNCWTNWILSNSAGKWMLAFRDALGFRTSHYFICFTASSIMLMGGYPLSQTLITKPLEIEVPRSLVQVVISWNIPMHNWLKSYVFRPGCKQLGKFGAIIMTYLASSLLHGLNFQLAAVLLSLGFYTYIEYQLRNLLANVFHACIASKQCSLYKCEHLRNSINCYWVTLVNGLFGILAMFHLAYLGLMFDTSDIQETGYSYSHTIDKWSQLGFASHWVAFATYCGYYLIR